MLVGLSVRTIRACFRAARPGFVGLPKSVARSLCNAEFTLQSHQFSSPTPLANLCYSHDAHMSVDK